MTLKNYANLDNCQNINHKRSRYPKYLNLLGDHLEMMTREHFLQLLVQNPRVEQTIQQFINEIEFMAPEIFFSPSYVSQRLGKIVDV